MKALRSIFVFAFALMVLMSSTSFMVGIHHCGGEVREVAILAKADGCGHNNLPPCHRKLMQSCCKDDVVKYDGQGFESLMAKINIGASPNVIVALPPVIIAIVIPAEPVLAVKFTDYPIPIASVDRTITNSVFLI